MSNWNDINFIMTELMLYNESQKNRKKGNVPLEPMKLELVKALLDKKMISESVAHDLNQAHKAFHAPKEKKVFIKKNNSQYPWGNWVQEEREVDPNEKKEEQKKNQSTDGDGNQPNTGKTPQSNPGPKSPPNPTKPTQSPPNRNQPKKSPDQSNSNDQSNQKKEGQSDQGDQEGEESSEGETSENPGGSQGAGDQGRQSPQSSGGSEIEGGEGSENEEAQGYASDDETGEKRYAVSNYINVQIQEYGDHRTEIYDSLDDFINAADDQEQPNSNWKERSSRDQGKAEWSGTDNFEEAISLARSGWPEGVIRLDQIADAYNKTSKWTVDKTRHLDVAGTYPNVPVFLGGDPACMFNDGELNRGIKPVMHILVNRGYSWLVPTERVFNFGAAIMVCIDQIETIGTRVELDIGTANLGDLFGNVSERPVWTTVTTIKKAQEYVEKNRLAYALAHPGYSRILKYSILEQIDKYEEPFHWGYGKPISLPADVIQPGTVYIPQLEDFVPKGQQHVWDNIESAVKLMQKHLGIVTFSDGRIELETKKEAA